MSARAETGACLRALRILRGWNQRQTAAAARVPPTRLSDYESGKISPTVERLEAIVAALGYPMLSFEIARHLVRTRLPPGAPLQSSAPAATCRHTFTCSGQVEEIHGTGLTVGFFVVDPPPPQPASRTTP
jgi:hypothetical protein